MVPCVFGAWTARSTTGILCRPSPFVDPSFCRCPGKLMGAWTACARERTILKQKSYQFILPSFMMVPRCMQTLPLVSLFFSPAISRYLFRRLLLPLRSFANILSLCILQLWGSKKFELQPATSVSRSHGVFHDRIKTLYTVFESSKKGVDLQMTACVSSLAISINLFIFRCTPFAESIFI
jgi:hypothetical protein